MKSQKTLREQKDDLLADFCKFLEAEEEFQRRDAENRLAVQRIEFSFRSARRLLEESD